MPSFSIDYRPTCRQCGASSRRLFEVKDLNRKVTEEIFVYYRCPACRVIFLQPVPGDLGSYYPRGYHEIPRSRDFADDVREAEQYKLDVLGGDGHGKRLLEIGPSYGRFAVLARDAGFDVWTIEMDAECCTYLRSLGGIQVIHAGNVVSAMADLGRFDVIALWHSIEHLPDPWAVLDHIPQVLNPGGVVAIATPNPQSFQFRLFGRHWVHVDAPRHVTLIPFGTLNNRLAGLGMQNVHFTATDRGAIDCNNLSWLVSPTHFFPHWMFRSPLEWIGARVRGRLVHLEKLEPYGSAYTAVFKRK